MSRLFFACISSIVIVIAYFIFNAANFERIKPSIEMYVVKDKNNTKRLDTIFFNPDNNIRINAFDSSGISSYNIIVTDSKKNVLFKKDEVLLKKTEKLEIIIPQIEGLKDGDEIFYNISMKDWSNANFFRGNELHIVKHLIINKTIPKVQLIATSEQISYGGSALIAFQIQDLPIYKKSKEESISKILVSNGIDEFEAYPFINKQGNLIYLALIAWPIKNTFFDGTIKVTDSAMNERIMQIPISTDINHTRRKFNININNKYLDNIVSKLEKNTTMPSYLTNNIEKFQFFNNSLRKQDNQKIANFFQIDKQIVTQKHIPKFNVFNPVNDADISGKFGDEYIYKYNKENVGTSIRYGIDFIGNSQSNAINSNYGKIVYVGNIGAYGNIVSINHALGLNSTYGYLKSLPQNINQEIQSLSVVGEIGTSGFNITNSIYFMTIVQGYFVNPLEWLNAKWIDININQVLDKVDNFGIIKNNTIKD